MKKKLTMADIAKLSGVTKSTVSRYFNGGYVKKETRQRIKQIIEEYHYQPNRFARLKAKDSMFIGVIVPTIDSVVTSRVLKGIDVVLKKHDYVPFILNTNHTHELEIEYLETLWKYNVDGVIISSTQISDEMKKTIHDLNLPVVIYAQNYPEGVCIINDDYHGGYQIGTYIGEQGLKNIGYINVDANDEAIAITRKQGVLDGLAQFGMDHFYEEFSDFSYQSAQQATEQLLKNDIDIIICSTDRQACGAYKVLQSHNLKIPDDISVISFGGYELSEILTPTLTTLKFDSYHGGEKCGETLIRLIRGEEVKRCHVLGYSFIEGHSVKKRAVE